MVVSWLKMGLSQPCFTCNELDKMKILFLSNYKGNSI